WYDEWPAKAVHHALQAEWEKLQVAAELDYRAFGWVRKSIEEAVTNQKDGMEILSNPNRQANAVGPLARAAEIYTKVKNDIRAIQKARDAMDDAFMRLPGMVPLLVAGSKLKPGAQGFWKQAVLATEAIYEILDKTEEKENGANAKLDEK